MKKPQIFLAIAGLLMLHACKRETDEPSALPDYYQLKKGNYWVYQVQEITDDKTITIRSGTDSVFIEKDTVINKNTYYKIVSKNWTGIGLQFAFYRDSIGYLVDQAGRVTFSTVNSKDTLYAYNIQDIARIGYKMDAGDSVVSVPAGSFGCLFCRCSITPLQTSPGLQANTQGDFRAAGIGIISSSAVALGINLRLRKNLIRYHVVQ